MTSKIFQPKSLRQRAFEYLSKREYSTHELAQKLKAFTEETDDLPALLEDFKTRGWLSDKRFTDQLVHARRTKFGSAKVANELREKGVDEALISHALSEIKVSELENATEVWRKKFKEPAKSRDEWAKQARFLQSRGFGFEVIKKVLNTKVEDDD